MIGVVNGLINQIKQFVSRFDFIRPFRELSENHSVNTGEKNTNSKRLQHSHGWYLCFELLKACTIFSWA